MAQMFCTQCGQVGAPVSKRRGSFAVELVLWLLFCAPGIVYSVWRMTTGYKACRACGAATLVPPNSPVAMQMRQMTPPR